MKIRKIIVLTTIISLIFGCISFASGWKQNIEVDFNTVNLEVNGVAVNANNILYDGTTYVPLRATAEMLGCNVDWDENTSTAKISQFNEKSATAFIFSNMLEISSFCKWCKEIYTLSDFTFTKSYWSKNFHNDTVTYYQGLTDYFNYISGYYKNLTNFKDSMYIVLTDKTEKQNIDNLYLKLDETYGKVCYIYSLVKNLMESSGYICTEQEFIDNLRQLNSLCNETDDYHYIIYEDYVLYLYK